MKIIVTGGAGFLGSHICNNLHKQGNEVIAVDDLSRGKRDNLDKGIRLETWDLSNNNFQFYKLLNEFKPGIIYHFAASNGTYRFYDTPKEVFENNIDITYNLLKTLEKVDCKPSIVYASTSEVYGNPTIIPTPERALKCIEPTHKRDSYAASKLICEFYIKYYCEKMGLPYLITRIFNVVGQNDTKGHVVPDLIDKIKIAKKTIKIQGDGHQTRSFCYIDDFLDMLFRLVESGGWDDIYNIGNPEEISIKYLVNRLMEEMNKSLIVIGSKANKGDRSRRCPDVSKLLCVIDEVKFTSIEKALEKIIE